MTPFEGQVRLARMVHAKATSDDLARALGGLVAAGHRAGVAWCAAVVSWVRLIGGQR